mgnify:CR=1 FL=1
MSRETIIVVEDEQIVASDLKMCLEGLGYRVPAILATGEEVGERIEEIRPDLVLMDIMLAGAMDGIAAAEAIRGRFGIPVIYITAHADPATIERAKITEPFGFILKPFDERALQTTLTMALYKTRMDRRIRESERKYRILIEQSRDGIVILDQDGKVFEANRRFAGMLGCSPEEVSRLHVWDWDTQFPKEQIIEMIRGVDEAGDHFETRHRRKDGSWFDVEISSNAAVFSDQKLIFCVCRDITERKQAEEKLRRTTLELKQYISELEQWAHVASHDMQEPVRQMVSFAQLLERRYAGKIDSDADEYARFVYEGAMRMQALIHDMRQYYHLLTEKKPFEKVALSLILKKVIGELNGPIQESGARILCPGLPEIDGNPKHLGLLFFHLLDNALKFRGEEPPTIRITCKRRSPGWLFSMKDNGIGIESIFTDQVFKVFKKLHPRDRYPGSGIGLPICRKVVENHGGRIWIRSRPGKGTTIFFFLQEFYD